MSVVRQGPVGATRICPHCKAIVLLSAAICPGCHHHLRFNAIAAESQAVVGYAALRMEGTIEHRSAEEACEYCVVVAISNDQGEKIARQVVGVGSLKPGERHHYSFSIELLPVRAPGALRSPMPPRAAIERKRP
jgi:hypothetical protein